MADEADLASKYQSDYMSIVLNARSVKDCDFDIRDGKYYRVDCGKEIPLRRVEALGGCSRCVKCQESFEKGM